MTILKTYSGQQDADFFIQCKGNHSGRPLKTPIPNCFAVYTDVDHAFEIVYSLYKARRFTRYIIGSVVPFIRKRDLLDIIVPAFKQNYNPIRLAGVKAIDIHVQELEKQIEKLKLLQGRLAISILKSGS